MSERRFTEKPDLNPMAVMSLDINHAAMRENRTLFPSTVVTVTADAPDRLLVSGKNNRKIGATVEKGKFKGYGIYCLSLEERATCPTDCEARGFCYGNGMQMARRHRIGDADVFFDRLGFEIVNLLDQHPGLLIRLHVLGDFPSAEYVAFWKDVLDEYPNVACFGYTHRLPQNWGGDEIGDAIQAVKDAHAERFRIRWSNDHGVAMSDSSVILDRLPRGARGPNGELVCPSQTDATACCATCALCWDVPRENIGFIKHGRPSVETEAAAVMEGFRDEPKGLTDTPEGVTRHPEALTNPDTRKVQGIPVQGVKPNTVRADSTPELRMVQPTDLTIESNYQRSLSGKSIKLIRKIVAGWDWAKFKPPVCAESDGGLFVIDGQHTAIAAASHPHVYRIPVMVVRRDEESDRAAAFVSQNTERVQMSPLQIFHAEVVARKPATIEMLKSAIRAGATIPRSPPKKGEEKPGEIVSVGALQHVWAHGKPENFERVLRIAVLSGKAPVNSLLIRGIDLALKRPEDKQTGMPPIADLDDAELAYAVSKIDIDEQSAEVAVESQCSKYDALASLIETYVVDLAEEYSELTKGGASALAIAS